MATFTFKLDGETEFAGALYAWERRKSAAIGALVTRTAEAIAEDAARSAPKRTGRLRESIAADVERALTELVGDVVAGVFYARMVELGTAKLSARPFLFPAWERAARGFYDDLQRILSS